MFIAGLISGFVRMIALVKVALWRGDEKIAERRAKRAESKPAKPTGPPSRELVEARVAALRERARREAAQIGPEPSHPREHLMWEEEWRGASKLLAALADYDRELLRLAATTDLLEPGARLMVLDAAVECRRAGGPR